MALPAIPQMMPRTGTARLLSISATLTAVAVVGYLVLRPGASEPDLEASTAPSTPPSIRGSLAGPHRTDEQERLRLAAATRDANAATNRGQSYTPDMGGFVTREPGDVGPQIAPATVRLEETTTHIASQPAAPATGSPPPRVATEAETKAKLDAMNALLASWRGKDSSQNIYEDAARAALARPVRPAAARRPGA
ncbi:hypothetical protein ACFQY5_41380 [Paeniroseomonas aquatica]|uniref:hypothetical protein n=1 Tax=Paeniroseomonas aquatica TaxID=373043 RepID=UPI003620EA37